MVDLTLAVPQKLLDTASTGYIEALVCGESAVENGPNLRVGRRFAFQGALWARSFRNRRGERLSEVKLLIDSIKEDS